MTAVADIGEGTASVVRPQPQARYRIVPAKHPWRIAGSVFAVIVVLLVLNSILLNPRWGWDVFAQYFTSEPVLVGLGRTLLLTVLGSILGFVLGGVLAFARVSKSKLLSGLAYSYVWLLRSIPLLVLLLVLNNLGYLYPTIDIGIPFTNIIWAQFTTTDVLGVFPVAVIGLSLNQAAFSSEIIRGGILSVDAGQREAAAALGLPRSREAFRIVLPQAMRAILPSGFNEIIGLAKATSIVYVLALPELFYTVQVIYRRNLEVIPLLMVATIWYLIILTILSVVQFGVERIFARGSTRDSAVSLFDKWTTRAKPSVAGVAAARKPLSFAGTGRRDVGAVNIEGVSKRFGDFTALDNVSLRIKPGEVTAILGPSGAGKSTLLRTINHLERADSGIVCIDGELIGYERRGDLLLELQEGQVRQRRLAVGIVFQSFNLFPHLTVLENIIEAPVAVQGVPRAEAETLARDLLARVGLGEKEGAYPRHLSGGQQQRVAIARALALKPKVLLFDEPTSALDPELVGEVLDTIKELASSGTTMVIVTHEVGFAREVADTIVFMEAGRVLEVGSPEQVFNAPVHSRTGEFLAKVL